MGVAGAIVRHINSITSCVKTNRSDVGCLDEKIQ